VSYLLLTTYYLLLTTYYLLLTTYCLLLTTYYGQFFDVKVEGPEPPGPNCKQPVTEAAAEHVGA